MRQARAISRRFPDYGWAWPTGGLDRLLKAVMLADAATAGELALEWLDDHDINDASFAEHRLLAALAERHGKRLATHPAYPRMAGLQKMLWSRSRIAYREARPVLAALADAGCPVMLLKGASRVAIDAAAQRGRVSHDIDILVPPDRMTGALDILLAAGWKASTGVGPLYLKTRIASLRALNFYKGDYGDLDLHQSAYQPLQASVEDDEALWRRAVEARLEGVPVLVPSSADRISLAIGHSGLDAHVHSDWLVDIDHTIRNGNVDWNAFMETLAARRLFVPAAVSLGYLKREIGTPLPEDVLANVIDRADRAGFASRASILEAKPRSEFGRLTGLARGVVKQLRLLRAGSPSKARNDVVWRARAKRSRRAGKGASRSTACRLQIPPEFARNGAASLEIILVIDAPGQGRRVEFELSTERRHLARLRYRKIAGGPGARELRFSGQVEFDGADETLILEARPSRHFRNWDNPEDVSRYGAVPFALQMARIGDAGGARSSDLERIEARPLSSLDNRP